MNDNDKCVTQLIYAIDDIINALKVIGDSGNFDTQSANRHLAAASNSLRRYLYLKGDSDEW